MFYWYRIWVKIDKDLRDEIDERQSFVDGMLYISFSLFFGSIFLLFSSALNFYLEFTNNEILTILTWKQLIFLCFSTIICAIFIYNISLPAHREFGEYFKALFDQYNSEIEVEFALERIKEKTDDPTLVPTTSSEKLLAAWRYLKWHKVRRPGSDKNENIETYQP